MDHTSPNPTSHTGADARSAPRVSVIMVCRDGLPWLPAALASLTRQTFEDWELVFWDNGSEDGSAELAAGIGDRARILGGAARLGLGAARRRAVEESRGRYVALLDADDLWREDKLQRQVARMDRGDVGLCYSDCHVVTADDELLGRYAQRSDPVEGRVREQLIADNFMPTCTVMVDRRVWDEAGGPDADLNAAADYEMWLRLAAVTKVAYDPEPLASYRVRPASLAADFEAIYGENRRIYRGLLGQAGGGSSGEGPLVRRALACLLWRWAGRELLVGDGPSAARRAQEAWAAAHGARQALADLSSCAVRTLRGFGLRFAMHRKR